MFSIRARKAEDLAFIVDSMCQTMLASYWPMTKDDYFPWFKRRVNQLIDRSEVIVACADDDDDAILGWMMVEGDCVHMLYVRRDVRRDVGIEMALLALASWARCYSHKTKAPELKGLRYRPDLAEKA